MNARRFSLFAISPIFIFTFSALAIDHIMIAPAENIIMPQSRHIVFTTHTASPIEITGISAKIDIFESSARTTLAVKICNTTNTRQEAQLLMPVPDKAVVKGFAYDGPSGEITAKVLPRDEAKRIYESIVAQMKDPALVEFIGYNLIRSSVFPIEPRGKQEVCITYEHLLDVDGNRIDYILPRSESLEYCVPWHITATIKSKHPISTVYSASHKIETQRQDQCNIKIKLTSENAKEPGPLRISYLLEHDGLTASMFAYPDENKKGGYFLLLAGLGTEKSGEKETAIKREVTIVIDKSGSMRNEKIKQVKEASLQIIAGLKNGEAFNVAAYGNNVEWFSKKPVLKSDETEEAARKYIENITATGGTNIYDALKDALEQPKSEGMLGIVLFLTDGLATIGQTSEIAIRQLTANSNPHNRRIFTIGVGVDLNAPLLDKIAELSNARSEFILPGEDVEVKMGKVFARLSGPVLADAKLEVLDSKGKEALGRIQDLLPEKLPDFFGGDQLILLGRYVGNEPITFKLKGNYCNCENEFTFKFEFEDASSKNGFVPRLWASRKIAQLIDGVRQMGADANTTSNNSKVRELIDEIVRLSTEFGILTEYTAFLAREGTDLADHHTNVGVIGEEMKERVMKQRSGLDAVSQSLNYSRQKSQSALNPASSYVNSKMEEERINNVQQINDRAYFRKDNRWVDSRLASRSSRIEPDMVIDFGSPEFFRLAERLARDNRQASIAQSGEIILLVDGKTVLIRMPVKN